MVDDFTVSDGLGITGSLMLCAAYWAVSRRRLDPEQMPYQLLNLGGAGLLLVSLHFRPIPGAILIEVLWIAIAITAILRIVRRRRHSRD